MKETVLSRFMRYAQIDTQSKEDSDTYPSTPGQWDLLRMLEREMKELGLKDVELDAHGYLLATLPGNSSKKVPAVALLAHVDTSPETSGRGVKPVLHKNYRGGDIVLPGDPAQVIKAEENPDLAEVIGHTLITGDGTTLLGSDDKAGIAAILALADHLLAHPEIKHGPLRIGFNPDEETGQGTLHLDTAKVKADYAYTIDGARAGEIENETFNAAAAEVRITGFNVHPGYAKDRMANAVKIAARLIQLLPPEMCPEKTEKRQGYIHPLHMTGDVGQASVKFILRDFEWSGIEEKVGILERIVALLKIEHPRAALQLSWKEQYRNMRVYIDKDPNVVDYALEAVRRMGMKPVLMYIRGGTDGSALTLKGLLTPNIFTGGHNFHSKQEWNTVESLETCVQTLVKLVQIWEEKA